MDYVSLIQLVGFPAAALVAVGYGVWRVVVWAGRELVIPLRDLLRDTAARLTASAERQDAALTHMAEQGCGRGPVSPPNGTILPFAKKVNPDRGA